MLSLFFLNFQTFCKNCYTSRTCMFTSIWLKFGKHFSGVIWLKFGKHFCGVRQIRTIKFGVNQINIEGVISDFMHKTK